MEKKYNTNKFTSFIKKNIYYLLMIACIVAIGTMITIAAINGIRNDEPSVIIEGPEELEPPEENDPPENNTPEPTITTPVFAMPVEGAEMGRGFSMDVLLYNETLDQWQTHNGIDFIAPQGTMVTAAYDGMVKSISTDMLNGTTVVIQHDDGLMTIYSCLDSDVDVVLNQMVAKGDTIGKISETALISSGEDPLLHFQVMLNDDCVDPCIYLPIENK